MRWTALTFSASLRSSVGEVARRSPRPRSRRGLLVLGRLVRQRVGSRRVRWAGAGAAAAAGGAASPMWKVSRSSRRRRRWSLLRSGFPSRASSSEVRRSRRTWLMTTSSASSSGRVPASASMASSGSDGVLQHRLAQLALLAVGDAPRPARSGGVSRSLRMGSISSAGMAVSECAAAVSRISASDVATSRWCRSSTRSAGLRGSAPWAAMSRRSRGTPPFRNCSTSGLVARVSAMAGGLLTRRSCGILPA